MKLEETSADRPTNQLRDEETALSTTGSMWITVPREKDNCVETGYISPNPLTVLLE
jgi:hypothetical protein